MVPTPGGRRCIQLSTPHFDKLPAAGLGHNPLLVQDPGTSPPPPLPSVGDQVDTPSLGSRAHSAASDASKLPALPGATTMAQLPFVLCLNDLLRPAASLPQNTQAEAVLRFPLPDDVEAHAFEPFALGHLHREVPPEVPLVPAAAAFLAATPKASASLAPDALMLFVDGSFRNKRSAWSVIVLGRCDGQGLWLGFRAGRVPDECAGVSVFEAELWAQFVAIGTVAHAALPAAIFYDSQSAALVAHGATAEASSNPLQPLWLVWHAMFAAVTKRLHLAMLLLIRAILAMSLPMA